MAQNDDIKDLTLNERLTYSTSWKVRAEALEELETLYRKSDMKASIFSETGTNLKLGHSINHISLHFPINPTRQSSVCKGERNASIVGLFRPLPVGFQVMMSYLSV